MVRRGFSTKKYSDVPGALSTRDDDTGSKDDNSFVVFKNLHSAALAQYGR